MLPMHPGPLAQGGHSKEGTACVSIRILLQSRDEAFHGFKKETFFLPEITRRWGQGIGGLDLPLRPGKNLDHQEEKETRACDEIADIHVQFPFTEGYFNQDPQVGKKTRRGEGPKTRLVIGLNLLKAANKMRQASPIKNLWFSLGHSLYPDLIVDGG